MALGSHKIDKWIRPWEIEKFDGLSIRDERFFSIVIKGCLGWMTRNLFMYNKPIKHFIFNTGSSYMYVESNGYDDLWHEVTGEDWMYMETPRCVAEVQEFTIPMEELTNPFIRGNYERLSEDGNIKGYNAEMRRLPIEITVQLRYVLSNFNESIILIQELFDKILFQRYYRINYLGQIIDCSIEFPSSAQSQLNKIDLASTEDNHKTIEISIKIKTTYPVINIETEIPSDKVIASFNYEIRNFKHEMLSDETTKIID